MNTPQDKFPEGLKLKVDKRMMGYRKAEYKLEMSDEVWRSFYKNFDNEFNARNNAFSEYAQQRIEEKIAAGEIDSKQMDTRGIVNGDLYMFNYGDPREENYSYRVVAGIYREWALANLPKVNGAEQLGTESEVFWKGYRERLLAAYEGVFLKWAEGEKPDTKELAGWLTNGEYSKSGFYSGKAEGGFDLSLFQDKHPNQTVQTIPSIKPRTSKTGSEVNTYFEANEDIRSRSDWPTFLEKLEDGVSRFFEAAQSENIQLATQNAVEILFRLLDGFKKALSAEDTVLYAKKFSTLIKNNPKIDEQLRYKIIGILAKTLVGGVDEAIVNTSFDLAEGMEDSNYHRELWTMYMAIVTPMDGNEARTIHQKGKKEGLEKEGWYYTAKSMNQSGVEAFEYSLTSIERTDLVLSRLVNEGKIKEAVNLVGQKLYGITITSTNDPCKGEYACGGEGENKLNALIAKFDDPEIKMRIEREVRKGWADPMGFRSDCENLNVRAFWLELVNRGKEKNWPEELITKLYDNSVHYDYTVGNW